MKINFPLLILDHIAIPSHQFPNPFPFHPPGEIGSPDPNDLFAAQGVMGTPACIQCGRRSSKAMVDLFMQALLYRVEESSYISIFCQVCR